MANPDPQALRDAAASLRDQAKAARDATVGQFRQVQTERQEQYDHAKVGLDVAREEMKSRQAVLATRQQQLVDTKAAVDKLHQAALDADKAGDAAKAAELREAEAVNRADFDAISTNADRAQKEVNESRVAVAQHENDMANAEQRYNQVMGQFSAAETQLDGMENKAKLLDEAGTKLALAATIDNPVERADQELAAEKLLKDANAITLDAAPITTITGQELQLPDVSALPAASPAATPGADATSDATPAGAGDVGDVATGAGAPGHLQDDFGSGDDGSGTATADGGVATATTADAGTVATADTTGADATRATTTAADDQSVGAALDLTAASDPLGVDTTAPVAADTATGFDATAPASDAGIGSDNGDATTTFDAGSDQPVAVADPVSDSSDQMADPGAVTADAFSDFGSDPSGSDAGATVPDDAEA